MTRDDLNDVLAKLSIYEGRSFTTEEGDAWYEVLGGRTAEDSMTAVVQFHSKPFTHLAYPGDINGLVEDIERARIAAIGTPELTDADFASAENLGERSRYLYKLVRQGVLTPGAYRAYQRSNRTLDAFLADQEVSTGA